MYLQHIDSLRGCCKRVFSGRISGRIWAVINYNYHMQYAEKLK
ncbi:hypothetical protein M901_2824 [Bacteriovorax sp. DB6_IX]|nr:hypothetical protein M901_2824 [Bacteriovorax sp. DB6_IX]